MKNYLVAYTAGWGDQRRWQAIAAQLFQACRAATGKPPVALMAACMRAAALFSVSSDRSAGDILIDLIEWLKENSEFETTSSTPDRLLVAEMTGTSAATDAVVQTSLGFR